MGDIADMILEGIIDEYSGEYLGEHNKVAYGTTSPGFPQNSKTKVNCPQCGKRVKLVGLQAHIKAVHGDTDETV